MIALGGSIGTGLFLGSAISIRLAGPGVILAYGLAALIALSIAWARASLAPSAPAALRPWPMKASTSTEVGTARG